MISKNFKRDLKIAASQHSKEKEYWLDKFSGELNKSYFPYDIPPGKASNETGAMPMDLTGFTFSPGLVSRLMQLSKGSLHTLHVILTALLAALLGRYFGSRDIIIGTPIFQQYTEGKFINTVLPLRNDPRPGITFKEFLLQVKQTVMEAVENQRFPVELLHTMLNPEAADDFSLFDTAILLDNIQDKRFLQHLKPKVVFSFKKTDNRFRGAIEYPSSLYKKATIDRIIAHYSSLADQALKDVNQKIDDIEILSGLEKKQLLVDFNNTTAGYPQDSTIHQLFEEQVQKTPDNIAVVGPLQIKNRTYMTYTTHITYRELNEKSQRLACLLQGKGVGPDTIVGIMLERSILMIVGLLAILKAGGSYLPIDPESPRERIDYMLADSSAAILLTTPETQLKITDLASLLKKHSLTSTSTLTSTSQVSPTNLAYIIYTSGSTGKPKGVLVTHKGIVNLIYFHRDVFGQDQAARMSQSASPGFDAMALELWPCLSWGAILYIPNNEIRIDPRKLKEWLIKNKITLSFQSTAIAEQLLNENWPDRGAALNALLTGGDRLKQFPTQKYPFHLYNLYGPTEDTVLTTWTRVEIKTRDQAEIEGYPPIGRPIANHQVYIMARDSRIQPIAVPGELYIGGEGVSRGYLNNPELTVEKFDHDKKFFRGGSGGAVFSKSAPPDKRKKKVPGKKIPHYSPQYPITPLPHHPIYHTGDLGRWLADGNIEFLGRIDHQVKIRGFRVELGEIENHLLKHTGIRDTVVVAKEGELCAYIVPRKEPVPPLRDYLAKRLPAYMIPAYFIQLKEIPLTPNGKVDRKALPAPAITSGSQYAPPRSEIEKKLIEIWAEILGRDASHASQLRTSIGIDDNFFELGGHSLRGTTMISNIHKVLNAKVSLSQIFKAPTIRELSPYISSAIENKYTSIEPIEKREYYSLSSAQKRLYFLQKMDETSTSYNIPLVLPLGKNIEINKLESAIKRLIAQHESLRTSFIKVKEIPVQRVQDEVEFVIEYYDMKEVEAKVEEVEGTRGLAPLSIPATGSQQPAAALVSSFIRPFDLSRSPLIRSGIIKHPDENYTWMVDIHHIISDGTSQTILTENFLSLYNDKPLVPLRLQYKDFSQWQDHLSGGGMIKAQEDYWLTLYSDSKEIPRLNLPVDCKRPAVFTFAGDNLNFILEKEDSVKFKALSARYGGTLYMNILTVLNTLCYRYTGQTDIIIGTGIAGRPHADLFHIIGMFVNTLAMRNQPEGEKTYQSFLQEVIHHCVAAFENQDVQFEELVDKLKLERDPSRNPLFDISMVVQNFRPAGEQLLVEGNLPATQATTTTAKFDMTFFVYEIEDNIHINLEYYTGIFKESTGKRLVSHFKNIVKAVIKEPYIKLKNIDMISQEEKNQILHVFNDTARDYPKDKTLHELFEDQATQSPDQIALVFEDEVLSYRQLDQKSNQLANYLVFEKQVRHEALVGILMERSIHQVIVMLGILKAGAAYLPLDVSLPAARIKHIIDDAQVAIVLSQKKLIGILNRLQWDCKTFHTFLAPDSENIYSEKETEKNELMDIKLWDYVAESAVDEITGGGWFTSYSGEPFTAKEMAEYGDNILTKLLPLLRPDSKVLEIGCGSGISMYRLAPHVGHYYATDLSPAMIRKNKQQIMKKGYKNITLSVLAADEPDRLHQQEFDLVIINSVIQSFHGHNYLRQVIAKSLNLMKKQGYIFIGDILDQDLKENLVREMMTFKTNHKGTGKTKTDWSADLFISRSFFDDLALEYPEINSVKFSGKIYTIENELTKFRYDTLLTIDKTGKNRQKFKPRQKFQHDMKMAARFPTAQVRKATQPVQLAYVIYTSGSTGKPKGVMVSHRNVLRLVKNTNYLDYIDLKQEHRFLLTGAFAFDITTFEIWGLLLNGISLNMVNQDVILDAEKLQELVIKNRISIIHYIPSLLNQQVSDCPGLFAAISYLLVGGDEVNPVVINQLRKKFHHLKILHMYGPTENTTFSTYFPIDNQKNIDQQIQRIPIGKPISHSTVYILDPNNRLQPIGVLGELYLGGDGIARGYLNDPELTVKRFCLRRPGGRFLKKLPPWTPRKNFLFPYHSPHYPITPTPQYPIYSTGDLARWLPDGNIEFFGRIDSQVKVRGYRVELGEIENQLLKYKSIKETVVIDKIDSTGNKYLCAYVVADQEVVPSELKDMLSTNLPEYMIPAFITQLEKIPLTPNGKIDRSALPKPEIKKDKSYSIPRDEIEKKLVHIWSEVLGIEKEIIGIDANFFELGGHSLKATILNSKVHKELKVKVPLVEVFNRQTIREFSRYIKNSSHHKYSALEKAEKKEYYELSAAQKRLYILQQMELDNIHYNMPYTIPLAEETHKQQLERTFKQLIQRHESLRTSFHMIDGIPVQKIHEKVEFNIEYDDIKKDKVKVEEERSSLLEGTRGLAPLSLDPATRNSQPATALISSFIRPFHLSQAPLLRVGFIKLLHTPTALRGHPSQEGKEGKYLLIIDMPHIISDGTSHDILGKEFMALYRGETLPPLKFQYKDYSQWQNSRHQQEIMKIQEKYWRKEFSGELPILDLPYDYPRPVMQNFEGRRLQFMVNKELTKPLKVLSGDTGSTLYMILLSVINILLSKLSGQEDIIVGTPTAGRRHADLQDIVGMFVNTLAMRNYPQKSKPFLKFLEEVKQRTLEAYENQEYQFEDLVDNVSVNRDTSRNPIFDVMFNLLNQADYTGKISQPPPDAIEDEGECKANFDITFQGVELDEGIHFTVMYCTKLYKIETIKRFINYFKKILAEINENPEQPLSSIEMLPRDERRQVVYDFNNTSAQYPKDKTLHQLHAEQVQRTPDHIALVGAHQLPESTLEGTRGLAPLPVLVSITYRELNEKANQLAHRLREKGVRPDSIVGIMVERSVEMMIGLFAILKAGGAYLPIDPEYPEERIKYMLKDSGAKILLTVPGIPGKFEKLLIVNCQLMVNEMPPNRRRLNNPPKEANSINNYQLTINNLQLEPANLAYLIYTSGSTGKPKGVMIDHRPIINFKTGMAAIIDFNCSHHILSLTTISFDIFGLETLVPLTMGCKVFIGNKTEQLDAEAAAAKIEKEAITIFQATPSRLQLLLTYPHISDTLKDLKYLLVGGEVFPATLLEKVKKITRAKIFNLYGPTETTIWSTVKDVTDDQSLNIGKPIANTQVYILSESGHLQPVGVRGELCIGGDGLGRGYLNHPELTAEKFDLPKKVPGKSIYNRSYMSYTSYHSHMSHIYKTGDLARWLPEGNIEFLGRLDQQVKIRGFRIEMGEIEHQLLNYPGIKDAVLITKHDHTGNKYLCAYIVPGIEMSIPGLRQYLAKELPDYMIPSYFVQLEEVPLTPNGKIDRKALPSPRITSGPAYVPPGTGIEMKLARIWQDILGADPGHPPGSPPKISIDDNFFELGGHSLRATIMISKIHKQLNAKVPLSEIFKTPTIRGLSRIIARAAENIYTSIEPTEKKEYYPLSSAQKRLYFIRQMEVNSTSYNMPLVLPLGKDIEMEKLETALKRLIARHESLRTSFIKVKEIPVQRVHDEVEFKIEYYQSLVNGHWSLVDKEKQSEVDCQGRGEVSSPPFQVEDEAKVEESASTLISSFIRPFDLTRAPLMRSAIIKRHDGNITWIVDIHHIVSDGTSHTILTDDFISLYNNKESEPLKLHYKDFSQWQNHLFESGVIKAQEDYWLELYQNAKEIPRLNLPVDYKRPEVFTFTGENYAFMLEKQDAVKFRKLGSENSATLYINILTALNTLFYKYTGQTDIIIGAGIAGRLHVDLLRIIGMFVNTLAIRNHPKGEKTYQAFLKEVIENSIKAFDHQDVQFEELVDKIDLERDASRNPLFDVMMAVQNFQPVKPEVRTLTPKEPKNRTIENPLYPDSHEKPGHINRTSMFDMTFFVYEEDDRVLIDIEYYTAIFKRETIVRLTRHFRELIKQVIANPGIKLEDINIITQQEKQQILYQFNNTETNYPKENTIAELFEIQVENTPDYTAIIFGEEHLTYKALDRRSNQVAHYLYDNGTVPDQPVGILMDRCTDMLITIMGILKAGGAYVPIPCSFPGERIKSMMDDALIKIIIGQKQYIKTLNRLQWECKKADTFLCIDSENVYKEEEQEESKLMSRKLWEYVGETAVDEITGGGWNSSYTGKPIPKEEMDEYGNNILEKLTSLLHPQMRILEIGCASGISMYRIAPKVGLYYGTDLSEAIIRQNNERIKKEKHKNIKLARLAAHEIHQLEEKDFDLVIINSVIQCFNGHNYLRKVLRSIIDLMRIGSKGYIFLGDLMDQELKQDLIQNLVKYRKNNKNKGYKTKTDWSEELFIARAFLEDLAADYHEITDMKFSKKIYTIENELTKFRYDALLYIDKTGIETKRKIQRHKHQHDLRILKKYSTGKTNPVVKSGNLAYIIYTSGSTGIPKGTLTTHFNVTRVVKNTNYIDFQPGDRILQLSDYAFDGSTFDIYGALLNGLPLVMVKREDLLDIEILCSLIKKERITVFFVTTALFNTLVDIGLKSLTNIRKILFGGERVSEKHVEKALEYLGKNKILHVYGPTETTVYATYYPTNEIKDNQITIPIGAPISNTKIYIMDTNFRFVPVGVPGELYISGDGVSRGYLNKPQLTFERFLNFNRFNRSYVSYRSYILYKTGDLGRWLPNGAIEFIGRIDLQVKVRGFRIELGEIQGRLLSYYAIRKCIVTAREDEKGSRYLCAYWVGDETLETAELKDYLSLVLPDFMIPSYFVQMEQLPLTSSGKIDKSKLPDPTLALKKDYAAPRDEIEKTLINIWSEVLGIRKEMIGIDVNFFELGGHSLKATVLTSKIHKELKVKVPLVEVFNRQTIREFSQYIKYSSFHRYSAIPKVEEKEYYVLSPPQKRLFILQQLELENTHYNIPYMTYLEKEIAGKRLENCFNMLIRRHESFRTSFHMKDKNLFQKIHYPQNIDFSIEYHAAKSSQQVETIRKNFIRPFDLSQPPLLRVAYVQLEADNEKNILLVDLHHIISDGTSQAILEREFKTLYAGAELPPLRLQYKDYSQWQNSALQQEIMKIQEKYWLKEFSNELPVLDLPLDYPRPLMQSFEGGSINFVLTERETQILKYFAKETDVTLYMVLLSVYTILLSQLSGQQDIIVGTPIAARRHADLEQIIGMFVNTLAIRNYPSTEKTFKEFLIEVKKHTLEAFENQEYPFENLVEKVSVQRDTSRNPIFDVMFNLLNQSDYTGDTPRMIEEDGYLYQHQSGTSKFDLNLAAIEMDRQLLFNFEYCSRLFKQDTIDRFIGYFKNILSILSINRDSPLKLSEIEIIPGEEKKEILEMCTGVEEPIDIHQTLHRWFEAQAAKTPDRIALTAPGFECRVQSAEESRAPANRYPPRDAHHAITYRELNQKSNQLAHQLRKKGVQPDTVVGLMLERSVEMIIAVLVILKAGGAYLPIDPDYPQERKKYMLEDSHINLVITNKDTTGIWDCIPGDVEIINLKDKKNFRGDCTNPGYINHTSDLLYVIYTSGSTGKPKGVMLEHRTLVNLIIYQYNYTNIDFSRVLQFTTISFDVSAQEIFSTLLAGGCLSLIGKETLNDIPQLFKLVEKENLKTLFLPASFLKFVMNEQYYAAMVPGCLKHIVTAGEQLVINEASRKYLHENNVYLHNHYGPTEAHVVTAFTLDPHGELPNLPSIGKPIANTAIYILSKSKYLQAIGVPGELYIGGMAVGRGYWKREQLTTERFVPNPFKPGKRMYRTGDLGKWLSNGNIQFLGRIDHQVKIRGFRVEPGEIENQLLNHPDIKKTVVLAREDHTGNKYLCAYIVFNKKNTAPKLREYLEKNLPDYMIPSYFIHLGNIPLTPNGKVDRKALPEPEIKSRTGKYTAPRDQVEKKLVRLWAEVLGRHGVPGSPDHFQPSIGIDDNFFEIGGHSLYATILTAKVHKELHVKLPLAEIFKTPRIRELAEYIKNLAEDRYTSIKPVEKRDYYTLSSAQKRLYILQQMEDNHISYNMPIVLTIEGTLEKETLETIFKKLSSRHESLRTSFHMKEDEPVQQIQEEVEFNVEYYDMKEFKDEEEQSSLLEGTRGLAPLPEEPAAYSPQPAAALISSFIRPFDLTQAPLLRVGFIELLHTQTALRPHPSQEGKKGKYLLMIDMHHIITDGNSLGILTKEFMALVSAEELPPIPIHFKDFAQWQNKENQKEQIKKQETYWLEEFREEIPILHLPIDFTRPAVQSFAGNKIGFQLDHEAAKFLNTYAVREGATLFMVLMAITNILLTKLSNQDHIVVGTPIAGRRHASQEKIIGMFVNTLALANHPTGHKTFNTFLKEVKEKLLNAYENQDYPFEELVEQVNVNRDTSRNPLFDVMFDLQNLDTPGLEIPGLTLKPYDYEFNISKFDLELTARETGEGLSFIFVYCTKLFKKETIERFINYYKKIVASILHNSRIKIAEIEIISQEEKKKILFDFNDTQREYPADKAVHKLFEEQAERSPGRTALAGTINPKSEIRSSKLLEGTGGLAPLYITYRELNQASTQLACLLKQKGVEPDTIVGIMKERSVEMIIGILGILKAGGAYLPIDPDYPQERINYMLEDSGAGILLTTPGLSGKITFGKEILHQPDAINRVPTPHLHLTPAPVASLAYVIYTSGSTGKPKGVMVEHGNVLAYIHAFGRVVDIQPGDIIIQQAAYSFDAFVEEVYPVLREGAKIVIPQSHEVKDVHLLVEFIIKNNITIIDCSPLLLNELNQLIGKNRKIPIRMFISGGDVLKAEYIDHLLKVGKIYNSYGPTETTVCITYHECPGRLQSNIPIGKPIANYKVYILDKYDHLLPPGVPGELYAAGHGVTRGYLNNPGLTSERFIFVSNRSYMSHMSYIIYKTGDLARWLPDGNIEFLGRIDFQVKIRGYRIELGEIQSQLLTHKNIKKAVAVAKEDVLCAYIVSDRELTAPEARGHLEKHLPGYMVPSYFINIEKIPLTPNGKVDRSALPRPTITSASGYAAPGNELEKKLQEIWLKVLAAPLAERPQIGINDNFFELGGHSLAATRLITEIHRVLEVKIPLGVIFKSPTIKGLSEHIKNAGKIAYTSIEPVEKKEYYQASSAQKRMFLLNRIKGIDTTSDTIPEVIMAEGKLVKDYLEEVLKQLIKRHEALRTSFEIKDESIVQRVHEDVDFKITQIETREDEIDGIIERFIRPFDLGKAPLFRVKLVKLSDTKHLLMYNLHHIITDGTSMGIFVRDFEYLYNGVELPVLNIQYRDFSAWQNKQVQSFAVNKQEEYWLSVFPNKEEIPVLEMPTDFPRPSVQIFEGDYMEFELSSRLTGEIRELAFNTGATLYMVLLSIYNILLSKYSGQEDIVVGIPVQGRRHPDLEHLIGMFVNTLAIRGFPSGKKTFTEFLKEVKSNCLKAYENQDYQFEELIRKLGLEPDPSRQPLFSTMFEHLDLHTPGYKNLNTNAPKKNPGKHQNLHDLSFRPYQFKNPVLQFDLLLHAFNLPGKIGFKLLYSTRLFKRETIENFIRHFINIIQNVLSNPSIQISEIEMFSSKKEELMLESEQEKLNNLEIDFDL